MIVTINPRGTLQIDDARIMFKNFRGEEGPFNRAGERGFSLIIAGGLLDDGRSKEPREVTAEEMAQALINETNRYGVGWNVKIKPAREEGEAPFMRLPVKISTKNRIPAIYVNSAGNVRRLDEESMGIIDDLAIRSVNLDIRPYDGEIRGEAFRSAYLESIEVIQEIDRFTARYAEEEYPEE